MENNNQSRIYKAQRQRELLQHWLRELQTITAIDLIWIEGSVANPLRENAGSDIDIRFALQDSEFDRLWDSQRELFFAPLGETYSLTPFRRATRSGILIEAEAYKTSQLAALRVYDWEILFSRQPDLLSPFIAETSTGGQKWPNKVPLNLEMVHKSCHEMMRALCIASTPFFNQNPASAILELEIARANVMQLMYWLCGVSAFARSKHLEQVLAADDIEDYLYTQLRPGESPFDLAAVARATLRCYEVQIRLIQALYQHIGQPQLYPQQWVQSLYDSLTTMLSSITLAD
ncbi:hypothetical protein A5320_18190 [Rheinheimera sp. SA_1]|uniref:hypothetical protein n=1 Tax=Rheinheimera sp. SA_1 TaxID=1827365 RepID=UPI00080015BB|nr:hypothetical protein [Rheinheimera sp. SA_1]OBP13480.1 hypothetical protein A5320_18190 [Rheinheimera sp. SA_1]